MRELAIFGAGSIALGACLALRKLYREYQVRCFLVSRQEGNPQTLAGLPVVELKNFVDQNVCVLIATPEDIHGSIIKLLKAHHFFRYICLDSLRETALMEQYYAETGLFPSVHRLKQTGQNGTDSFRVYMAKSAKDTILKKSYKLPDWCIPIQAGAALSDKRIACVQDCEGENISYKNNNYCELTVLYWIWKQCLRETGGDQQEYYGLFHYRRILDFDHRDMERINENKVDVILPYPMIYEPNIGEHHKRYLTEGDWQAVMQALSELAPAYREACDYIFAQTYFYNYNMLIAKKEVLCDYCQWLFPILKRIEELSSPKAEERADRYMGYIGESLLTLYFFYNQNRFYVAHTGRLMLI